MNKTEILTAIVQKQDELINHLLKSIHDDTTGFNREKRQREEMIKELASLQQKLDECKEEEKILSDFANKISQQRDMDDELRDAANEFCNDPSNYL